MPNVPKDYIWTQCGERALRLRDAGCHLVYEPPTAKGKRGRYWYPGWVGSALRWLAVCDISGARAYAVLARALASDEERQKLEAMLGQRDVQALRDYAGQANGSRVG